MAAPSLHWTGNSVSGKAESSLVGGEGGEDVGCWSTWGSSYQSGRLAPVCRTLASVYRGQFSWTRKICLISWNNQIKKQSAERSGSNHQNREGKTFRLIKNISSKHLVADVSHFITRSGDSGLFLNQKLKSSCFSWRWIIRVCHWIKK